MDNIVTINLNEVETKENTTPVDREKYSVSPYAVWFNEKCGAWSKDPVQNKFYLLAQQDYANEKLRGVGYLFLNDVYDMIGSPRTKAGQVVGWVYDPNSTTGDNYVDFGLFNQHNEDFINGYENSILLDFNVDGMILDRI